MPWRSLPLQNSRSDRKRRGPGCRCTPPVSSRHPVTSPVWIVVTGTLQGCFRASGGGQALSLWLARRGDPPGVILSPSLPSLRALISSLFHSLFLSNLTRQYPPLLETIAAEIIIHGFICLPINVLCCSLALQNQTNLCSSVAASRTLSDIFN